MKKFSFSLENVLNVKQKIENQARMDFSVAQMRLNNELDKQNALIERREGYENELRDMSSGSLDVIRMRSLNEAISTMKELIEEQKLAVKRAENRVELERKKLADAVLERKTIEKLKEKSYEAYIREYNADEAAQVNELVSYRYGVKNEED